MEDIEFYGTVKAGYSSATGLRVISVPDGIALRPFLSQVRDHWPVNVPACVLARPENQGLGAECVTCT